MSGRKYTRLNSYDYSSAGAYFITACTNARRELFGTITNGSFEPNSLGQLVDERIHAIPEHHGPSVKVDSIGIMPNHIHLILLLLPKSKAAALLPPETMAGTFGLADRPTAGTAISGSVGAIVGSLKASVTRHWRAANPLESGTIWQTSFHEHVIRHDRALERIRDYISNNPRQWTLDRENPRRSGEHEIYRWLESYYRQIDKR